VEVKNTSVKNVLPAAVSIFATPAVSRRNSPDLKRKRYETYMFHT
jgi:hypothetical protein